VPWYRDYHDIVRSDDYDMVIISAPHGLHCDMACAAMEAGKPVMIQKPMCITVSEADRIIETARRTGTRVGTFHTAHTSEWDALSVIRSGKLGDLMRFSYASHASRSMAYYNSGPWRGTWALEGSGVLSNQCIHDINRMHALAGPTAKVTSCTLANLGHPGIAVEDACARSPTWGIRASRSKTRASQPSALRTAPLACLPSPSTRSPPSANTRSSATWAASS